ncbi:MAG: hypothetical protein HOD92_15450 [Deltaproteobacteria bacterium]|jgi:hypothetical protein|nr:hypothetical protein [Deltaproteobacteria bacterium]MBT4526163.1 hypothetical protein [Deltaproteobacteria bacterium]
MSRILISYLVLVCGMMAIVILGLNLPASAGLRTLLYASLPTMVALGTLYVVIEHLINRMKKNNSNNLINMPVHQNIELAKSA